MVTNDDVDNTENEYPLMNEIFARRPVRERKRKKSYLKNSL
jgi:serine/threonine protein kinase